MMYHLFMEIKQLHKKIKELSDIYSIEWGFSLKTTTGEFSNVFSEAGLDHLIEISERDAEDDTKLHFLVAKAKIYEELRTDPKKIEVSYINYLLGSFTDSFSAYSMLLVEYWATMKMRIYLSADSMSSVMRKHEEIVADASQNSIKRILSHAVLESFDMLPVSFLNGKREYKLVNLIKKYGSKQPSLYEITRFYNGLNLQSEAVVLNERGVLLTLASPANRF